MRSRNTVITIFSSIIFLILGYCIRHFIVNDKAQYDPTFHNVEISYKNRLNQILLKESLSLGKHYLLECQKPEGNFIYEYDFVNNTYNPEDSQVRQAGALWGISLIHQDCPSNDTKRAIEKGLDFFYRYSVETKDGRKFIAYPKDNIGKTGTVSLLILSLIDYLRSNDNAKLHDNHIIKLNKYIRFLLSLQKTNSLFYKYYSPITGKGFGGSSPYFDGEALLALVKAAKYLGHKYLKDIVLELAEQMYQSYIMLPSLRNPDSDLTRGFYQWGSMAFYEIYTTDWRGVEQYANRTIDLAYWMIDVHRTLERRKNTAYAYEGLITAWELARLTNNHQARNKIGQVINKGLYKLISWQIGGPIPNKYLHKHNTSNPKAIGGVMNSKSNPKLRIDVTQHQMHALILARRFIHKE